MSSQATRFASERDLVAQFLLPKLKEAPRAKNLPILDPSNLTTSERERLSKLAMELNDATILRNEAEEKLGQFVAKPQGQKGL